ALQMTPQGLATIPVHDGQPVTPQSFEGLPEEEKAKFEAGDKEVRGEVGAHLRQLRQLETEAHDRLGAPDREGAAHAGGPLSPELRDQFSDEPAVVAYIEEVGADLPGHLRDFLPPPANAQAGAAPAAVATAAGSPERQERLARYQVNVL